MAFPQPRFADLCAHYPQGDQRDVNAFLGTPDREWNTCALRLSYALNQLVPGFLREARRYDPEAGRGDRLHRTPEGLELYRGARGLARHLRDHSGWAWRRLQHVGNPPATTRGLQEGQGIVYWERPRGTRHIDLWDTAATALPVAGRTMLWIPRDGVTEVWYWELPRGGAITGMTLIDFGFGGENA